jgi:hypothetical protein
MASGFVYHIPGTKASTIPLILVEGARVFTCYEHQTGCHRSLEYAQKNATGQETVIVLYGGGGCGD